LIYIEFASNLEEFVGRCESFKKKKWENIPSVTIVKSSRIEWEEDESMKVVLEYLKNKEERKKKRGNTRDDKKNIPKSDLNQIEDP
jgi:hypothetical protein